MVVVYIDFEYTKIFKKIFFCILQTQDNQLDVILFFLTEMITSSRVTISVSEINVPPTSKGRLSHNAKIGC